MHNRFLFLMVAAAVVLSACGRECPVGLNTTDPSCAGFVGNGYNQYQYPGQQYPQQYPGQYPQQYPQQQYQQYPNGYYPPNYQQYPQPYYQPTQVPPNPYQYPCDPRNPYCY